MEKEVRDGKLEIVKYDATGHTAGELGIVKKQSSGEVDGATTFRVEELWGRPTQGSDGRRRTVATRGLICRTPLGFPAAELVWCRTMLFRHGSLEPDLDFVAIRIADVSVGEAGSELATT